MSIYASSDNVIVPIVPTIKTVKTNEIPFVKQLLLNNILQDSVVLTDSPIIIDSDSPIFLSDSPILLSDSSRLLSNSSIFLTDTPISIADTLGPDPKYLKSINVSYSRPTFALYENLNADPQIRKRLTKYFYYKILDKYLYNEMIELLNFLTVSGGKVNLISSMSKYDPNVADKESEKNIKIKAQYFEDKILTKKMVYKMLKKFVAKTGSRWVDLPQKNEYFLIQSMINSLKKKLKKMIK